MNDKRKIPDAETRARNVARMRDACKRLDALILALSELLRWWKNTTGTVL